MNERRASTAAGNSWRKWEDRVNKTPAPQNGQLIGPITIQRLLFWLYCIDVGIWFGIWFHAVSHR